MMNSSFYLFFSLFAVPLFEKDGFQKWVRFSFLVHTVITPLVAFVYFYPNFSDRLLFIAVPWAVTAPATMLLLALLFRNNILSVNDDRHLRLSVIKQTKALVKA